MAALDPLQELLFGSAPQIQPSGAFPRLPELGFELQKFLLRRLRTPAAESDEFGLLSEAMREQVGRVARTQGQRASDVSVARGFFDSGDLRNTFQDIDRAELESFTRGIRDVLLALEQRRTEGVLPFLSAGAQEALGVNQANLQSELSSQQMFINFLLGSTQMGLAAGGVGSSAIEQLIAGG